MYFIHEMQPSYMKINLTHEIFISDMELNQFTYEILLSYVELNVKFCKGVSRPGLGIDMERFQS